MHRIDLLRLVTEHREKDAVIINDVSCLTRRIVRQKFNSHLCLFSGSSADHQGGRSLAYMSNTIYLLPERESDTRRSNFAGDHKHIPKSNV